MKNRFHTPIYCLSFLYQFEIEMIRKKWNILINFNTSNFSSATVKISNEKIDQKQLFKTVIPWYNGHYIKKAPRLRGFKYILFVDYLSKLV